MKTTILAYIAASTVVLCGIYMGLYRVNALAATSCGSPASGCPEYSEHPQALPTDGTIGVQTNGSPPPDAGNLTANAISEVNGNSTANGTNDTLSTTAPGTTTLATINVTYDNTDTEGPCGQKTGSAGCSSLSPGSGGTTSTVCNITIYSDVHFSNGGSNVFDPSKPGYAAALQKVLMHEIYHCLGIGDTDSSSSLMGPVKGINDASGTNDPTNCDNQQVKTENQIRSTGNVCSAGQ